MHGYLTRFAVAALLGAGLTGCSDFLSGPSVDQDPNSPTVPVASADNLFVGIQSTQFANLTSTLAVTICGYVQGCRGGPGTGRFVEAQLNQYQDTPNTFATVWDQIYGTGGLVDLRQVQTKLATRTVPDPRYDGIIKVWEAIIVSSAADVWGDIPYSQAADATVAQPKLDDQGQVYSALITLLDQAIAQINDPTGIGPGVNDLVYAGAAAPWTALAHTLKARLYLHTVRASCGASLTGCAVYTNVITEATQGLLVDGSQDFKAVVNGSTGVTQNGWYQFYASSGFGNDLRAGAFIVNLMGPTGRNDPRFTTYFGPAEACGFSAASTATLGLVIARSCATSGAPSFAQPWITGDENALMLAEAYFETGNAGNALIQLNAVKTKYGVTPAGAATLDAIIEEKYVTLFQNPEVWSDYRRTCLPALQPTAATGPVPGLIPRRAFYGQQEFDNNRNTPSASDQIGSGGTQTDGTPVNLPGFRNKNDPAPPVGCTPLTF